MCTSCVSKINIVSDLEPIIQTNIFQYDFKSSMESIIYAGKFTGDLHWLAKLIT